MRAIHLEDMHPERGDPWSRRSDLPAATAPVGCATCSTPGRLSPSAPTGPSAVTIRGAARRGMAWARLRREPGNRDARPYNGDQVLTGFEALQGYTTGAA
jgi:hypothetical protein